MQKNQIIGFMTVLLLVIVVLLTMDISQRQRTAGGSLHEVVQDIKGQTTLR